MFYPGAVDIHERPRVNYDGVAAAGSAGAGAGAGADTADPRTTKPADLVRAPTDWFNYITTDTADINYRPASYRQLGRYIIAHAYCQH
jgi:hypothetical protein